MSGVDPMTLSERKIEDALLNWLHGSALNECNAGSDTCDNRPIAREIVEAIRPALQQLEGAVDETVRQIAEAVRANAGPNLSQNPHWLDVARFIEREFGGRPCERCGPGGTWKGNREFDGDPCPDCKPLPLRARRSVITVTCPTCHGDTEIPVNPSRNLDPRCEVPERCPDCGDGTVTLPGWVVDALRSCRCITPTWCSPESPCSRCAVLHAVERAA